MTDDKRKAPGRPGELASRQCATLAQRLVEAAARDGTKIKDIDAIKASIKTLAHFAVDAQKPAYLALTYGAVRKMLTRLQTTQQWIYSSGGMVLLATTLLENSKRGAVPLAKLRARGKVAAAKMRAKALAEIDAERFVTPEARERWVRAKAQEYHLADEARRIAEKKRRG